MKVYMVIEIDDGGSGGWGEYVRLCGIYTNEHEAYRRKQELDATIDEEGYLIEKDEEFLNDTRYTYDVIPVEVNKDIDELLGGYAE
ncbi:MAG: hypothetical protein E6053_07455 [Finegoldia magna]|uniref:hypothetical protein n=1 Tax=Finegoldia magna TaxID=1260 RepID=UPI00290E9125|nr:hypothetical protein [Finegoldia magna]MDU5527287.1 hypothetical protein [Finegoldia magna]